MRSGSEKGFIFTLDGTLAVLISLIVLTGVAQIGTSSTHYSQHGSQQLQYYANDGLRSLKLEGAVREAIELANENQDEEARKLIRKNLTSAFPEGVQYKFQVGGNTDMWIDNVYPTEDPNENWERRMENAEELTTATSITVDTIELVDNLDVLVWIDDPVENDFVEEVLKGYSGWTIKTTDNEAKFRDYLQSAQIYNDDNFQTDVVFIPDSDGWDKKTTDELMTFNFWAGTEENFGGGVVAAGDTVSSNYWHGWEFPFLNTPSYWAFIFGINTRTGSYSFFSGWDWERNFENNSEEKPFEIIETANQITEPFSLNEEIPTENHKKYEYIESNQFLTNILGTDVEWLARWRMDQIGDNIIENMGMIRKPHVGTLTFPDWWPWPDSYISERSVLINAQAIRCWDYATGTIYQKQRKWEILIRRAIEWGSREQPRPEPVQLTIWRGEGV